MLIAARIKIAPLGAASNTVADSVPTMRQALAAEPGNGEGSGRPARRGAAASCSRLREQLQIVRRAHQTPFALDLGEAPEQKLPEAARVLDDPEDGLHRPLAQPVPTAPAAPLQPPPHRRHQRADAAPARPGGPSGAVSLASSGDVGPHVAALRGLQIGLRAVP